MKFLKWFADDSVKSVNPIHVLMALLVLSSIGWVDCLRLFLGLLPRARLCGFATIRAAAAALRISMVNG